MRGAQTLMTLSDTSFLRKRAGGVSPNLSTILCKDRGCNTAGLSNSSVTFLAVAWCAVHEQDISPEA